MKTGLAKNLQSQSDRDNRRKISHFPRLDPPVQPGQPVYLRHHGFCEITAVEDGKITVSAGQKRLVVQRNAFVTLIQAQGNCHFAWVTRRKRRLLEGEKLFIVKGLSRYGEWQAFLDEHKIPRSTALGLIDNYLNHLADKGEVRNLSGYRTSSDDASDPQNSEHNRDSDEDERRGMVEKEREKRLGRKPSHATNYWALRIKLPPSVAERCRDRYRRHEKTARKFWQEKAYEFAGEVRPSSSEEKGSEESSED